MDRRHDRRPPPRPAPPSIVLTAVSRLAREAIVDVLGRPASADEWRAVLLDITERRAVLCTHHGGTGSEYNGRPTEIWAVVIADQPVRVVWDPASARVVTILDTTPHRSGNSIRPLINRDHGPWWRGSRRKTSVLETIRRDEPADSEDLPR